LTTEALLGDPVVTARSRDGELNWVSPDRKYEVSLQTSQGGAPKADEDGAFHIRGLPNGVAGGIVDGMGGHVEGARAGSIGGEGVADTLMLRHHEPDQVGVMRDALFHGHQHVVYTFNFKGGAAAAAYRIVERDDGSAQMIIGHTADARIYLLEQDGAGPWVIRYITRDQSEVPNPTDWASADFHRRELEARVAPRSHFVNSGLGTMAFGSNPAIIDSVALHRGRRYRAFLVSDGVTNTVSTQELFHIFESSKSAEEAQRRALNLAVAKMNILNTAVNNDLREDRRVLIQLPSGSSGWLARERVEVSPATPAKAAEHKAIFNVYDAETGGTLIDHIKLDHVVAYALFYNPPTSAAGSGGRLPAMPMVSITNLSGK
jgi:serine/threonine protein phosphatase PrpC